ncbi:hypothetical protein [Leptothoe spongobia]|uniref:Uncharacterized protein n=1 Tax=Leptothoe spongobia TAU-MAC 1115 TaxID=1967444 RepID=A0A947DM45_9CYAN|nr:hypothetical protein [Leptothoe spongobia]MBT9318044.1 hypothetical protein [Leptothoe spongobia TAU-MAC 1115]
MYKLPDVLYSWAKPVTQNGPSEIEGGLLLFQDDRPGLIHFSRLVGGDQIERSWLWLSSKPPELISLRLLPSFAKTREIAVEMAPIRNALPPDDKDAYLQVIEKDYLKILPLPDMGIHEIWLGFNYTRYASSLDLPASCEAVVDSQEFLSLAKR